MVFPKDNTIRLRNRETALESEALLWRALCDSGPALKKYLATDAVLVFPGGRVITTESEPSIEEYLEGFEPWTTYKILGEPEFVEIDMMATSVAYKVELGRLNREDKLERVQGMVSSVWRQDSGGDWRVCMHHLSLL